MLPDTLAVPPAQVSATYMAEPGVINIPNGNTLVMLPATFPA
jgi:hypothetical protein